MQVLNSKTFKMAGLYVDLFSEFQIVKVKRVYIVQYCIFVYNPMSFGHNKRIASTKAQVFYVGSEQPGPWRGPAHGVCPIVKHDRINNLSSRST